MNTKAGKENGADKPPSQSASSTAQRSRLRRTLLFASVFALLAMIFVPTPRHGYRFVFDQADTSIAFFQLLVNVIFAAALGAIAANLSKRARWVSGCIVVVAIASYAGPKIARHAYWRAEAEERYAEAEFVSPYCEVAKAQKHFRNAAFYWRLALQFKRAELAEARANGAVEEMEAAQRQAAERKEELERRLAQEAQKREFDRQWEVNAQRVIDAHPELAYENSLYSQAMRKVLNANPVYSQRVDGFELAYKVIMKQLPPPTNPRTGIPTSEFNRLLEGLKADVAQSQEPSTATSEKSQASDTASRRTAPRKAGGQTYVVQSGDTLLSISRKFYNSPNRWKDILDANKQNIRDPKRLTVGQTLTIP
jgi:nucleoid-associated protein YgaU